MSGIEFVVPPTFESVSASPSSPKELWETLQDIDPLMTLSVLAALNVLLEIEHLDPALEQAATERYIRPQYHSSRMFDAAEPQPHYPFIFNRVGVLIALKCAIGVLPAAAPSISMDERLIGDLVLRANDFINSANFQGFTSTPSGLEIAAEVIPIWELTNPRDLAYGMARVYRMFEYLGGDDPIVKGLTAQLGLAFADLRCDKLPLQDFIAVVFGLHAYVSQLPPGILLRNPSECAVNRERFLSRTKFPQQVFDDFLANRSFSLPS